MTTYLENTKVLLTEPWYALMTSTLGRADHPSKWYIEETVKGATLVLGEDLPGLSFLSLPAASVAQGVFTLAKFALMDGLPETPLLN